MAKSYHPQSHLCTDTPEFGVWSCMLYRCETSSAKNWHNYGGRGIKVCERWHKFENFLADMGPRPGGRREYSIERIDNDGNYEPGNCKWATYREQGINRRVNRLLVFGGRTQTITEWGNECGITPQAINHRLSKGWTLERIFSTPSIRPTINRSEREARIITLLADGNSASAVSRILNAPRQVVCRVRGEMIATTHPQLRNVARNKRWPKPVYQFPGIYRSKKYGHIVEISEDTDDKVRIFRADIKRTTIASKRQVHNEYELLQAGDALS